MLRVMCPLSTSIEPYSPPLVFAYLTSMPLYSASPNSGGSSRGSYDFSGSPSVSS